AREESIEQVKKAVVEELAEEYPEEEQQQEIDEVLQTVLKEEVRRMILVEKKRPDGRSPEEIRPLTSEAGILPRTHGSGHFRRGQTQVVSVCTLGALGDVQILDGLDLEESKRFMHHYNF